MNEPRPPQLPAEMAWSAPPNPHLDIARDIVQHERNFVWKHETIGNQITGAEFLFDSLAPHVEFGIAVHFFASTCRRRPIRHFAPVLTLAFPTPMQPNLWNYVPPGPDVMTPDNVHQHPIWDTVRERQLQRPDASRKPLLIYIHLPMRPSWIYTPLQALIEQRHTYDLCFVVQGVTCAPDISSFERNHWHIREAAQHVAGALPFPSSQDTKSSVVLRRADRRVFLMEQRDNKAITRAREIAQQGYEMQWCLNATKVIISTKWPALRDLSDLAALVQLRQQEMNQTMSVICAQFGGCADVASVVRDYLWLQIQ